MKKLSFWFLTLILILVAGCSKPSPQVFLPNKCQVPGGFMCTDISANGKQVSFNFENALGSDITEVSICVAGCTNSNGKTALSNAESAKYTLECNLVSGKRFKGEMTINYKNQGQAQTQKGEIEIKG